MKPKTIIRNGTKGGAYADEYYTPSEVIEGLPVFDVDPFAGEGTNIGRLHNWTKADDGFSKEWNPAHLYWINGPFSEKESIIEKVIEHNNSIVLFPASSDSRWYGSLAKNARGIFMVSGRIKFIYNGARIGNPAFASHLFAMGEAAHNALMNTKLRGLYFINSNKV